MLVQSLEGVITASGASPLTFDQVMAQLGAQVSLDYLFGTAVSPGTGQIGITNLTQLATYFNAWGDSMIPPSWGDTPLGNNGRNFNSDMERFQSFNTTNHVFTANSLALTAVNEQLGSFQTSITTGTSGTQFTLPAAVPIATLGLASTQTFGGTGGTGGVSSVSLVISSVAQGGLYQGNAVIGPGIPTGTHVVAAPVGNGAGTYTLNQAVTVAAGSSITSANAPVVGQILCSMFRGFYQITAVTTNTSLTLAPILNSNGTNIAFNNATVLLPYYYTTLAATLTTGATSATLTSIPAGVSNGMMFSIANGSAVVSNSTSRISIAGNTVTFDNPWTYNQPTFPVGQGVIFMQPITSGQIWSNTYYLPTATNWVAFDEYVTFPTDSAGGQNLLSNTTALTITNASQIAAVPQNFAWGAFPSCWMYGGNFPSAGQFDTSEVDFITTRYYPPQGPWTNVMGFFNNGNTATVASLNPAAVASTTTAGQGANEFLNAFSTPTNLILYSGQSLAGAHRVSTLWTSTQVQTFIDNIPTATINYTWTGAGYAQLGIQNCVGTFNSSGHNLSFPLLGANFLSYVTSVSRLKVFQPAAVTFNFYISPTGDDNNAGTLSSPWSITALNGSSQRSLYAGKSVGLLPGTYQYGTKGGVQTTLYSMVTAAANSFECAVIGIQGGTAGSPTIVQSTTPRAAILDASNPVGGALPTNSGIIGIIGQGFFSTGAITVPGNFILDGVTVRNSNAGSGVTVVPISGSGPGGATGCVVRNCEIYNIGGNENGNMGAVFAYWCTGLLVQNNKMHDIVATSGNVGLWDQATIMVQECKNNIYEYNTMWNTNDGIYDKNSVQGSTIRYNYIEIQGPNPNTCTEDGNSGPAGTLQQVYNNIFVSPTGHWATSAQTSDSPSGLCNWTIYNNTYYCPTGAWAGQGQTGATIPTTGTLNFYNNIGASTANGASNGILGLLAASAGTINYNAYQGSPTQVYGVWSSTSSFASSFFSIGHNGWDANGSTVALGTLFGGTYTKIVNGGTSAQFQSLPTALQTQGRVGGTSGGAAIPVGAWGGTDVSLFNGQPIKQIGCNF